MPKFVQRDVSTRFREVFDELIQKELVENMKEFCKRMDYLPQSMSQIRKGKRDVTLDLIIKLFYEFGGNPVYILLGYGDKILDKNTIPVIPKDSDINKNADGKLIKKLEELVESKNEYIALLKKEVERLSTELGTKGK